MAQISRYFFIARPPAPSFMAKSISNSHFDYLNSLIILCRKYTEESAWIHKTADQLNGVPMKVGNAGSDSDISTSHNCIAHKNT